MSDELDVLDPITYLESCLSIRTKDKRTAPLILTPIQRLAAQEQALRNVYLKPRQVGLSTLILGQNFARTVTTPNFTAVSIAHDKDTTELLFDRVHFFYNNLPEGMQPKKSVSSRGELFFPGLNSRYYIYTAGGKGPGRGDTVNAIHGSEVSRWPDIDSILAGLMESAPKDATIDLESTPNGAGTKFHTLYTEARERMNGYKAHFFPWWLDPGYTLTDGELKAYQLNPDDNLTEDEERLMLRHQLTREQINWRRWKQSSLKSRFAEEYPEDDESCFLTSGNSYFDNDTIIRAKNIGVRPPVEARDNGSLLIWQSSQPGHQYLIGADVAEGLATGDWCAASVLDQTTGDEVATLHGRWTPHVYASKLADLGRYYNMALLAPERNNHGHAVLVALLNDLGYPKERVYHHKDYDASGEVQERPGFPTTSKTKPIMLSTLAQALYDAPDSFHDAGFFGECSTFSFLPDGSIGAIRGCFDDRVMCRAIAQEIWSHMDRPRPFSAVAGGQRTGITGYPSPYAGSRYPAPSTAAGYPAPGRGFTPGQRQPGAAPSYIDTPRPGSGGPFPKRQY